MSVSQLGYLGLSVADLDGWRTYANSMLGLEEAAQDADGTLYLGMDQHHNRFQLQGGGKDDIAFVGWQVDSPAEMAAIAQSLDAAGIAVRTGTRGEAEKRRVTELIAFEDPDGNPMEVFHGPELAAAAREERFLAGDQGLGHLVLYVSDLDRTMAFYQQHMGFKVSDYVKVGRSKLGFLHCNRRHHSIAFGQYTGMKQRIHHFMLQLNDIDPVGRAFDKANAGAVPLVTTLGRHSNDEMVSFYMRNPSGFAVEYGWGAREIDDACWDVIEYDDGGSLWGHKPVDRFFPQREEKR